MRRGISSSPRAITNVSIRKIAERIEYSPAAIYSYFPSKDDIFFALAEEGFRLLFDGVQAQRATVGGRPAERDPRRRSGASTNSARRIPSTSR